MSKSNKSSHNMAVRVTCWVLVGVMLLSFVTSALVFLL